MKIGALVQEETTPAQYFWRVEKPFEFISKYHNTTIIKVGEEIPSDLDILVLPKMYVDIDMQESAKQLFNEIKVNGTILVYDADDDMWTQTFTQYMTQTFISENQSALVLPFLDMMENRREAAIWTASQCDAITVSTTQLKEAADFLFEQPVYVIPNAIDVQKYSLPLKERESDIVTIGWAGGSRPYDDLANMFAAWNIIADKYKNTVQFRIVGFKGKVFEHKNLTKDNVKVIPWQDIDTYIKYMDVDIGCVCVGNSEFAQRKSPIKAWEFALANALVVGSANLYHYTEPIVTCNTIPEWVTVLSYYIENATSRKAFAKVYKQFVYSNYDIAYNWVNWIEAYDKILAGVANVANVG